MKKMFNFRSLAILCLAFGLVVSLTRCKKYDDDVNSLQTQISALKANVKKDFNDKVDVRIAKLQQELAQSAESLEALKKAAESANAGLSGDVANNKAAIAAAKEELQMKIAKAKEDLMSKLVSLEMYKKFKQNTEARIEAAATKEELSTVETKVNSLDGRLATVEAAIAIQTGNSDALKELIAKNGETFSDIKEEIKSLSGRVQDNLGSINELKASVQKSLSDLGLKVDEKGKLIAKNSTAISANTKRIIDNANDIKVLMSKILANKGFIDSNKDAIDSNKDAIDSNKDAIATKASIKSLNDLRKELTGLIDAAQAAAKAASTDAENKSNQALIDAKEELKKAKKELTDEFDLKLKKVKISIEELKGRLTSLVLVPDYVADRAGALPVLNFSPVKTSCGYKDPEVLVRYMVNPSNASLDQIDVNNIKFYYNDPMVAAKSNKDGVGQMAKFVSLENGVLTVKAIVESEKLWASKNNNNEGRIDQLMLQVPLKDGNVINSDWVKVTSRKTSALIAKKLTRKGEEVVKRDIPEYVLKNTVTEAKNIDVDNNTENYTVVDLVYNEELDLSEVFKALYNNYTSLDTQAYGFKFKFDFNNEDGQPISYIVDANNYYGGGVTKTDQQDFIEFVPGSKTKVRARLFDENGNNLRAAIGRTPILHVSLVKSDDENCVVKNGFVKLNIVDKYVAPKVIEKVYTSEITAGCFDGGAAVVDLVGTEAMNKDFYQAVPMSRTEFIQNYYLTYGIPGETNENQIGYVRGYAIDPSIEKAPISTTNLAYVIPNNVVTDKEYYGKTVSRTFYFVRYNNSNDYFKVTFKVTIKAPETVEVNRFNEYWKDSYATQNVAVPNPAGTNDASKCTWDNNINAVFANKDKNLALPEGYNYEYVFTKDQFVVDGVELKASSNGKELRASGELVAIIKDHTDSDNNEGDILSYNETSEVAKKLLNSGRDAMRARLAIKVTNSCGMPISVNIEGLNSNQFVLRFLRPINFSNISTGSFQDGVGFGQEGSYLNVLDVVKLTDWRGRKFSAYKNFYGYYGVSSIVLDKSHVTLKNGQPLPSTIELNQVFDQQVSPDTPYYGKLTYKNNGSYLQSDLVLVVPVTVTYKWGKIVSENVEITVKKTSDVSSN